ncbi:hypothetical protein [Pseudothauera rhizosphaerae]|uniref:Uncharacterized protein n=1 Tax=Pseudothauera rhizosphaerae TaxID=2565932 RepID=A0A4S4AXA0_9RHOO|nr:hypothetical protein [Pseudothauera rhizosphaerae]THF64263.1 hypothetical protein E6O51_02790 [Pseudothauera rhizosphaerae]
MKATAQQRTAAEDDMDQVDPALGHANAILDLIFTLASTGDIEGLCDSTLSTATGFAMELIEGARTALDAERAAQGRA